MPGILTNLFEDGGSGSSGQSESTQQYDAGAHGGVDLSPTIAVSHEAGASWEDPNGTTHEYSSDTDIVFTAEASAALGVAGSLTQSSADEG